MSEVLIIATNSKILPQNWQQKKERIALCSRQGVFQWTHH